MRSRSSPVQQLPRGGPVSSLHKSICPLTRGSFTSDTLTFPSGWMWRPSKSGSMKVTGSAKSFAHPANPRARCLAGVVTREEYVLEATSWMSRVIPILARSADTESMRLGVGGLLDTTLNTFLHAEVSHLP